MQLALLVARLFLAAVFLLAGLAKFADPQGTSKALKNFGLPRVFTQVLTVLLPFTELAVAAALIPVAAAWYGACAALALLGIFVIGIAITLARGRAPDCNCFGQLHSAPIGKSTLARNAVLAALAGWLVLMGPMRIGPSLLRHLASAGDNERKFFLIAALVMLFLTFRALRQRPAPEPESVPPDSVPIDWWEDDEDEEETPARRVSRPPQRERLDPALQKILEVGIGWPIGTPAPDFTLPDITGEQHALQSLRDQGKSICLIFSSPHCDPCRALWPYISRWAREHEQVLNVIVLSRGAGTAKLANEHRVDASRVWLQQDFALSESYGVSSTPTAVLVSPDGLIQSQLAIGRDDISQLIASAVQSAPRATSSS